MLKKRHLNTQRIWLCTASAMIAFVLAFGLAGCDTGGDDGSTGAFTIIGYPGPANQQLYANTNGSIIDGPVLVLSSSGIGNINADGTVSWVYPGINGPSGTFWLYIFMADSSLMRSNTQIAMSSGQVAYSEFTPIADEREDLEGELTINPSTDVTTGTKLTANYDGSETINTWQWAKINIDGFTATAVGTNSNTFTPLEAGLYTVTISAAGYKSKTSAAVNVSNPPGGTPDESFVGRWGTAYDEQLHIRIYEDGTGYLSGWKNSTPVSINGNTLTIEGAGVSASATLSINGGKLTLSNRTGNAGLVASLYLYELLSPFDRFSSFGRVISAERIAGTWESPNEWTPGDVLVYEFNEDLSGVRYTEEFGVKVGSSISFTYTVDIKSNGIWTDFGDDIPEWYFLWVWAEEDLLLEDIDIAFTRRSGGGGDDGDDLWDVIGAAIGPGKIPEWNAVYTGVEVTEDPANTFEIIISGVPNSSNADNWNAYTVFLTTNGYLPGADGRPVDDWTKTFGDGITVTISLIKMLNSGPPEYIGTYFIQAVCENSNP